MFVIFFALPLTTVLLKSVIIIPRTYTLAQYFDAFHEHPLCNVEILLKGKRGCKWYSS